MNLSLSQKGLIVVAVPLLFQLAFVLAIVRFQQENVAAEGRASHTTEVIAHANELRAAVADGTVHVRGYLITHEPGFAARFHDNRRAILAHFDALDQLVSDNPEQTTRARVLRAVAEVLLEWQDGLVAAVGAGAVDEAATRIRVGGGEIRLAAFRREIDVFLAEEDRLDRERRAALDASRERLNVLLAAGGVSAVGCTLFVAFVFSRGISHRFAAVEDHARRLALGERLPEAPVGGRDEIARLDRAFRDMAAELTRAADEARDLYDHAPCGYHSVDRDGVVLAMNRAELRWLGYDARDVVGRKRFIDFVAPGSRETYLATFRRVKESGAATDVELELVRHDGATFPVLLNSSAVRDAAGNYLRSRTTLTDLTERKRAEVATRLLADVTRNVPVGLVTFQLDPTPDRPVLRAQACNECAERMLGFRFGPAVGRPIGEVFPAVPDDMVRRYSEVAAEGRPDDLGELKYGDDRVTERWWSAHAFPLPHRSVGVAFQDISARKQAESEVRRLNEELEQRVHDRTAALEHANRDLAAKNAENEMFVYSVSHDLRSPLVNLQGFSKELEKACRGLAELLAGDGVSPDVRDRGRAILDVKVVKSVGFIQSAVMRLSNIIDALLRLSRAGRVDYRIETVDVGEVVARVVRSASGTIAERGATVAVGDLPPTRGDRTAIEQLFGNLIGNALTYLDPTRPGVIEVGATGGADGARVYYVRDNGLGIADGHRHKIFQAFQRAHPGVGSGEGLGLAIVARVAERHRGRVWVESQPGAGSTFFVALPPAG